MTLRSRAFSKSAETRAQVDYAIEGVIFGYFAVEDASRYLAEHDIRGCFNSAGFTGDYCNQAWVTAEYPA